MTFHPTGVVLVFLAVAVALYNRWDLRHVASDAPIQNSLPRGVWADVALVILFAGMALEFEGPANYVLPGIGSCLMAFAIWKHMQAKRRAVPPAI